MIFFCRYQGQKCAGFISPIGELSGCFGVFRGLGGIRFPCTRASRMRQNEMRWASVFVPSCLSRQNPTLDGKCVVGVVDDIDRIVSFRPPPPLIPDFKSSFFYHPLTSRRPPPPTADCKVKVVFFYHPFTNFFVAPPNAAFSFRAVYLPCGFSVAS